MEDIVEFELNNKVLNDFDSLMNIHLDKIEILKITSFSDNSKAYNIIGLCSNLKTIKIIGNLKINTNNIFSNIFNPKKIESIILDGVKLPTTDVKLLGTAITGSVVNMIFLDPPEKYPSAVLDINGGSKPLTVDLAVSMFASLCFDPSFVDS